MEFEDDCLLDRSCAEAKLHGMTEEEFLNMPDEQKRDVYCNPCKNWDCHAKRKYNTKS